jgi:hypothetical protein
MKLKQKLARESYKESKSDYATWEDVFIAGFEKAREMARFEATRFSDEPEAKDIEVRISEMGNGEVEGSK